MGELAEMLGVTANWMTAAKKAGAPFPLGKSRPEWILKFLAEHPNLQLKEFDGQ
jgi:hypothetical protein